MARKSGIHVRPVSSGSEIHNRREKELSYVRSDLSHLNSRCLEMDNEIQQEFSGKEKHRGKSRKEEEVVEMVKYGILLWRFFLLVPMLN